MSTKRKILVVEDDETMAAALNRALKSESYEVLTVSDADQALNAVRLHVFHAALVDCILPKASGLDLAQTMLQYRPQLSIILMSGVCGEDDFVNEVTDKIPHAVFFRKPFEMESLFNCLKLQVFGDSAPERALDDSLMAKVFHPADEVKSLSEGIFAPGMDLPRIISRLVSARATGRLEIKSQETGHSVVSFADGRIVSLHSPHLNSYQQDIIRGLGKFEVSDANRREIAGLEMGMQMGDLIIEGSYNLKFDDDADKVHVSIVSIDENFRWFVSQWIESRVSLEWLKAFFEPLLDCQIHERGNLAPGKAAEKLGMKAVPAVFEAIRAGVTLKQLVCDDFRREHEIYAAVYALVCADMIYFDRSRTLEELTREMLTLEEIVTSMESKTDFKILGVPEDATKKRVDEAYARWSQAFDVSRVPANTPDSIRILTEMIGARLLKAYNNVRESAKADEKSEVPSEDRLRAEILFEEGKRCLKLYDGMAALRKFEEAIMRGATHSPAELTLCCVWAQLLALQNTKTLNDSLTTIRIQLESLPHEMRHTSTYYFVCGLMEKRMENWKAAKLNFNRAISMESSFVEAKRELHILALTASPLRRVKFKRLSLW